VEDPALRRRPGLKGRDCIAVICEYFIRLYGRIGNDPLMQDALRFLVFTCRDPRTDFRLSLVEALRHRGYEVHYVWLKRRPLVLGAGPGDAPQPLNLLALLRYLRRRSAVRTHANVYFTTTNLCFPSLIFALRALCAPGVWCFDMHDDLLYALRGKARLRARFSQALLLRVFDLIVHAAPTLKERFPCSHHLGNASSLERLQRTQTRFDEVLVLASIDPRMDFAFFAAVAAECCDVRFEIYGQISHDARAAMQSLLHSRPNIRHHGAYVSADLVPILSRHAVMLAPYVADSPLTRYIDPLRFYHALNSGMEVITTGIPQAAQHADRLFIVRTPSEAARVLRLLQTDSSRSRNAADAAPISWNLKAGRLVEILRAAPRMQALLARAASARHPRRSG